MTSGGTLIAGVEIRIRGIETRASTNTSGEFVLDSLPTGDFILEFRRIGFRPESFSMHLAPGELKRVKVVMEAAPYTIPEVTVTGHVDKPIEYAYTHKYDDFFRRQKVGLGAFVTRRQIDFRNPLDAARLLSWVPGVTVSFQGYGHSDISVRACRSLGVWIDGAKQRFPELYRRPTGKLDSLRIAVGELVSRVLPSQIEMVEVYRGPSEMPAEFLSDECAIVIWTR
jgi:hypothetical protein